MIRSVTLCALALAGTISILDGGATAQDTKTSFKIDMEMARRLAAEAVDEGAQPNWFDYSPHMSRPFFSFDALGSSSANGSMGFFAVNPWTGDVWALCGCHLLSTPALRKSQAEIRRHFTPEELKRYAGLRRRKPDCIVENK